MDILSHPSLHHLYSTHTRKVTDGTLWTECTYCSKGAGLVLPCWIKVSSSTEILPIKACADVALEGHARQEAQREGVFEKWGKEWRTQKNVYFCVVSSSLLCSSLGRTCCTLTELCT